MPHHVVKATFLIVGLQWLGSPARAQSPDTTTSLRDGAYTEQQARRGERIYSERCAECHAREFFTETFLLSWSGVPVRLLFEVISTSMPEDRPGSLKGQQYADVLAYVFEMNGLPSGSRELSADPDRLERILIERRQ